MQPTEQTEKVIQHFISMIEAHDLTEQQIYQLGNQQKMVYAIVDRHGNIHAIRKGYGIAKRALKSERFCFFSQLMEDDVEKIASYYQVIPLHLEDMIRQWKEKQREKVSINPLF